MKSPYDTVEALRTQFMKRFYQEELFSSIVVFSGTWQWNDLKFEGFISANNEFRWNSVYQDIEIDAYGREEFGDLVEVFWKKGDIPDLVPNFIGELLRADKGRRDTMKPAEIYFSIGAPEHGEVENLIALHLRDRRSMFEFLYSKLRRDEDSWIKNRVVPLSRSFYVSSITEPEIVHNIFKPVSEETLLVERFGRSVTYIAGERDSFSKFYKKFKEAVFKPASKELPRAETIKKIMKKGLERIKTLD